jgi:2-amino-4-hydroxy-6-hydroxymethyldihydropteridine diphosphokinase
MKRISGTYLLLGTNIGDRFENLQKALELIEFQAGKILKKSSVYETAAWGFEDQATFLNMVVCIETDYSPEELLKIINTIEISLGRIRYEKWKERTIDIDILYYDNLIINSSSLIIPHPGITQRKFTLIPLVELIPDQIHPVLKLSQKELLSRCSDPLNVDKLQEEL